MPISSARSRWIPTACWSTSTHPRRWRNCASASGRSQAPPEATFVSPLYRWNDTSRLAPEHGSRACRIVDQIIGEVGGFRLHGAQFAGAGQGAGDDDVVFDMGLVNTKHADGTL